MFEKVIEAIGRLLSLVFGTVGNVVDNINVEKNMIKDQVKSTTIKTKSTLNISVNGESHVNYFKNRVVGEFLRVMSALVPYEYEESSNKYVAYFVRNKRKSLMEYVKFSKNDINDTNADISYTIINKLLSSIGTTTKLGNTKDKVLLVDENTSRCMYEAISGNKAPLYLVHVLDNRIGVGNPAFVYDCWITTVKLISRRVDKYMNNELSSEEDKKLIEVLMTQAGVHMFMSYFKSLNNPFYRTFYKEANIKSIVEGVNYYNSLHFNTNTVIDFSYDSSNKINSKVEISKEKDYTVLQNYGVSLKLLGAINGPFDQVMRRFNYKFAETLLLSDDKVLRRNFLFYMFSTGGVDNKDIIELKEEELVKDAKINDKDASSFNDKVEPVVNKVMKENNFTENEEGDLESKVFESFITDNINIKSSEQSIQKPEVLAPIVLSEDLVSPTIKESSSTIKGEQKVEHKVEVESDIVRRLAQEANSSITVEKSTNDYDRIEKVSQDTSKSIEELLKTPITLWETEDCMKVLGSNEKLESSITRQDILDRLMFLSSRK